MNIRWMIRRDMPEIVAIEAKSFLYPWSEDEFIRCSIGGKYRFDITSSHG